MKGLFSMWERKVIKVMAALMIGFNLFEMYEDASYIVLGTVAIVAVLIGYTIIHFNRKPHA